MLCHSDSQGSKGKTVEYGDDYIESKWKDAIIAEIEKAAKEDKRIEEEEARKVVVDDEGWETVAVKSKKGKRGRP